MQTLLESLHWVFPNWQVILLAVGAVGVVMPISALMNNQHLRNKQLNTFKTLGFTILLVGWSQVSNIYAGHPISWNAIVLGSSGWLIFIIGDWGAYLFHKAQFTPGGLGGMLWRAIARIGKGIHSVALDRAEHCLDNFEREVLERQRKDAETTDLPIKVEVTENALLQVIEHSRGAST